MNRQAFGDFQLRSGEGYRRALQRFVERNDAAGFRVRNRFAERNPAVVRVNDVRRRRYDRRRRFLDEQLVSAEVDRSADDARIAGQVGRVAGNIGVVPLIDRLRTDREAVIAVRRVDEERF